jgi:hypothetical protein
VATSAAVPSRQTLHALLLELKQQLLLQQHL